KKIVYLAQCKLLLVIKYYTCFTCRGIYEEKNHISGFFVAYSRCLSYWR
ncbi:secretion system protein E, partial [Salmonella enterica subsp. enterica serovar Typhimurium]|nr:secretion system protein E [Salmonella enterica subsp. enterica serovar Typhimurium]